MSPWSSTKSPTKDCAVIPEKEAAQTFHSQCLSSAAAKFIQETSRPNATPEEKIIFRILFFSSLREHDTCPKSPVAVFQLWLNDIPSFVLIRKTGQPKF